LAGQVQAGHAGTDDEIKDFAHIERGDADLLRLAQLAAGRRLDVDDEVAVVAAGAGVGDDFGLVAHLERRQRHTVVVSGVVAVGHFDDDLGGAVLLGVGSYLPLLMTVM